MIGLKRGHLEKVVDCSSDNDLICTFVPVNTKKEPVEVDISKFPDVPLYEVIEVIIDDGELVSWGHDTLSAKMISRSDKDVALIRIEDENYVPTPQDQDRVNARAKQLQDEYRRISAARPGHWTNVSVTGYVYPTDMTPGFYTMDWRRLKREINELYDQDHYYIHTLGGEEAGTNIRGRATLGGYYGCTYWGGMETVIHEQGHMFGMNHSSTPAREYGETKVWMGNGNSRDNFNAPHIHYIGLMDDSEVEEVLPTQSKEIFLVQSDLQPQALRSREMKMAFVPTTVASIRKLAVSFHDGKVDVHKPYRENAHNFGHTSLLKTLDVGESYIEEIEGYGDIEIRFIEEHEGCARVQIYNNTTMRPQSAGAFTDYAEPDDAMEISQIVEGIWDNPDWTVQGLHIHYLGEDRNQVLVYWLTWDYDYDPEWYMFVGDINDNNVARGEIFTAKYNITTNNGPEVYSCGRAIIYWEDENNGMMKCYNSDFHNQRFAFPFARISRGIEDPINGYWHLENTPREGITVNINRNAALVYWCKYDFVPGSFSYGKNQDWLMISGPTIDNMTVYRVEGGYRGVNADFTVEEIGTASITNQTFNVTVHGESNSYPMRRLA